MKIGEGTVKKSFDLLNKAAKSGFKVEFEFPEGVNRLSAITTCRFVNKVVSDDADREEERVAAVEKCLLDKPGVAVVNGERFDFKLTKGNTLSTIDCFKKRPIALSKLLDQVTALIINQYFGEGGDEDSVS